MKPQKARPQTFFLPRGPHSRSLWLAERLGVGVGGGEAGVLAREAEGVSGQDLPLPPPPNHQRAGETAPDKAHSSSVAQLTTAQAASPGPAVLEGGPLRKATGFQGLGLWREE